jgi:hypothetical protein
LEHAQTFLEATLTYGSVGKSVGIPQTLSIII